MVNPYKMKKNELIRFVTGFCRHRHTYATHPNCFEQEKNIDIRKGFLDIETSGLFANFGIVLSYAIKEEGTNKIYGRQITPEEMRKVGDKQIIEDCIEDLLRFDKIFTYNGSRFDIPFLRTRAMKHHIKFPFYGIVKHEDVYYMARNRLRLHRKSLDVVCRALNIKGKTHVDGDLWIKAITEHNRDCLKQIFEHNKADVEILEKVYEILTDYCRETNKSI